MYLYLALVFIQMVIHAVDPNHLRLELVDVCVLCIVHILNVEGRIKSVDFHRILASFFREILSYAIKVSSKRVHSNTCGHRNKEKQQKKVK